MRVKARTILWNGIIRENPVLVLILGTCPTLAVTTQAINGVGMGVATMAVLICSNVVISLLKNIIPAKVRIPCYITVIAGFVIIVGFLMEAFASALYEALGIFLSLIVVNCIILGRAEMFAAQNGVWPSFLDGLGMGLGFTLALFIMGSVREILGSGTWFGITLTADLISPMAIFMLAPGGFFVYGCLIALVSRLFGRTGQHVHNACRGCGQAKFCHTGQGGTDE